MDKFLVAVALSAFLSSCSTNEFNSNLREQNRVKEQFVVEEIKKTTFDIESVILTVNQGDLRWHLIYVDKNFQRFEKGEKIKIRFRSLSDNLNAEVFFLREGHSEWECCFEMMAFFDLK